MKTVAKVQDSEDAYLLTSFLAAQGIRAYVLDEYMVQQAWYYSNAIGGVRVVVDDRDEDAAEEQCNEYFGSLRKAPLPVATVRAWPVVMLLSLMLGLPFLIFGRKKSHFNE